MRYKITVEFEVEDNPNFNIEKRIKESGLELVQKDIADNFRDPEFEKLTCKIQERCGDCNGSGRDNNDWEDFCRTCRGSGYEKTI